MIMKSLSGRSWLHMEGQISWEMGRKINLATLVKDTHKKIGVSAKTEGLDLTQFF